MPAAFAAAMPVLESSIAIVRAAPTPRRRAASRFLMVQSEDFPLRVQASSSEKLKDLLDRFIGFSVCGFERGCRGTLGVRRVVEQTVRERAANALLKEHEE
jgi:hypothetical protein